MSEIVKCPQCHGEADMICCEECHSRGYVPKEQWELWRVLHQADRVLWLILIVTAIAVSATIFAGVHGWIH